MSELLKGNYRIEGAEELGDKDKPAPEENEFEARAMERLGGSIAFVMKRKKLVWDEDGDEAEK